MAKGTGTYTTGTGNAASFKNVCQPISAVFNAGMTRTADTGQVDWTTNPATSQYEVFAFGDSGIQSTAPLFVRVDYVYSASYAISGVRFSIGTGTTGAGTLTGILLTSGEGTILSSTVANSQTRYWYACASGTDSYLTLAMHLQPVANSAATTPDPLAMIVLERTRDGDGTANNVGITAWKWFTGTDAAGSSGVYTWAGRYNRYYDTTLGTPAIEYDLGAALPNLRNNATYISGTAVGVFPCFTAAGVRPQGASKALMLAYAGDIPRQQSLSLAHYGTSGTWIALGAGMQVPVPYLTATAAATTSTALMTPVMRWE